MKVLVVNSGSSTLKYQLFDIDNRQSLTWGRIENITDFNIALKEVFDKHASFKIDAIGHRVVHGGESFNQSTIATPQTIKAVEDISHLAPLHNPANILGVKACMSVFPKIPNVMVFDTAFHSTMPKSAYMYGLPLDDFKKHGIRRYGFHGTSHDYVSKKAAEMYGKPREQLKIISCHIGNGSSICAIQNGKSVETSMGLTPLEGLVMGTRCGDIDPAALLYISRAHGFTIEQTVDYLNKQSGLLGLCGIGSCDMRDIALAIENGNKDAEVAFDVFVHRIVKYVGAYVAVMGGLDAIVFTGGIGNNIPVLRERVLNQLGFMGARLDPKLNNVFCTKNNSQTGEISAKGSTVRTFVICTNEELEIALQTSAVLTSKQK